MAHRHIRINKNAVASFSKKPSKETLKMVEELVRVAEQRELDARALIAGDLYKEGGITREECFRIEMDAALGENSGDLKFKKSK
jgi:hypothetical protein